MKAKVYNAFGKVPNSIPPSQPVRRVDHGIALFSILFLTTYPGLTLLAWLLPDSPPTPSLSFDLLGALAAVLNWLSLGVLFKASAHEYLSFLWEPWKVWIRVGSALVVSLGIASWVGAVALRPSSNTWHVKGPRLLEGKESIQEARRRSMTKQQIREDGWPG
ncbi:hypothetical protein [Xanthomonas cannabis]|uniref:hypothetical protein n=1 Tax=Xanthomonas cannabis TaxID=1885674 RepID=UPI0006921FE4|nr:hypothetical protein [Xanthomonas cannabis]